MVVLGITGRRRNAASALAVDGRIVAAVSEANVTRVPRAGYRDVGFPVASAAECLRIAGVAPRDVGRIVSAGGAGLSNGRDAASTLLAAGADRARRATLRTGLAPFAELAIVPVGRSVAQAWQAAALSGHSLALVADIGPTWSAPGGRAAEPAAVYGVGDGTPALLHVLPGMAALFSALARVAERLGWTDAGDAHALEFLELLAAGDGSDAASFAEVLRLGDHDVEVVAERLEARFASAHEQAGGPIADAASPNVRVQRARAALAGAALARAAELVGQGLARWRARHGGDTLTLAGDAFACPAFNARLRAHAGDGLRVVPVPERDGCALGAALSSDGLQPGALDGLALGPAFTESEAKSALENARLDYLYEPRWDRLLTRVSRLLSRGKLVAWFQGAAEFGPRSLGGRSVLCNPSDRYVRENVNRFLKQRDDHAPLPVSIPAHAASEWLEGAAPSPWMLWRARVRPEYRDKLRSAVDGEGYVTYHTVTGPPHQALADLLRVHHERTGVPALVNTTLAGPGEPTALTPRDAIRSAYSSSIDALVLQRFVLMKDYWQMRTEAE